MANKDSVKKHQDKFEVLTGREQILKRPGMWIGSVSPIKRNMFLISQDETKVDFKEIEFVPAFRKIVDEILDNSLDALIEHRNSSGSIKVEMTDDSVYIEDDGPGIPVIKKKLSESEIKNLPEAEAKALADSYIPQIAWTRLFSGTNFQDSSSKTTIGSHGIGSKAAAVFSTKFVGTTDDGKKKCVVTVKNNLESSSCKVSSSSGKSGTNVEFWPDLVRFGLKKIEPIYLDLIYQRMMCLAMTFPKIKFTFNKKRIQVNDKKFLSMFSENMTFTTFKHGFIGIYPNDRDDFNFFTYVNGLHMSRGGTHIDYIAEKIVLPMRDKLEKKYKTIKPADIKNKLSLVVFMRDFANAKFDSQTKETLTNLPSEITTYLANDVDFEKLSKELLKNEAVIAPIIETFKIKEELKARQELRQAKKVKVKSDKYLPPLGGSGRKYLALCEGASAQSGISACLGREGIGYYAMRGLPLNAYDSSMQKIVANQELKDITNILGLDISSADKSDKFIAFEKVLITTDADADAQHITAMLIGWFKRFAPNLFKDGKICKLITPNVIIQDKNFKIKEYFFSVKDFKKWESEHPNSKDKVVYIKGLGSWEREQLQELIDKNGLDKFIIQYRLDDKSDELIEDWLGNDPEKRKKHLSKYTFDINAA